MMAPYLFQTRHFPHKKKKISIRQNAPRDRETVAAANLLSREITNQNILASHSQSQPAALGPVSWRAGERGGQGLAGERRGQRGAGAPAGWVEHRRAPRPATVSPVPAAASDGPLPLALVLSLSAPSIAAAVPFAKTGRPGVVAGQLAVRAPA